ncbi:bifunctional isocitrate dehydrogenase kinase/phosphatase [Wenzhouxiangella marina]|uniref:Isocitrate dehydrogenase kinase/phosphatase n=1 Tax=Wenzhouxiangella marina TaxID=1579979 RepID=A0A0K0XW29_9GAMM|nr:bifunctional isocitrate dehydrogenase kinase/phosphatase [Wenzhouxiangella marina]AKS41832.1 Isocitrate dehydrogenase kinase/phosphatase [Wenzhouxiangella marina]MBB6086403.1 isocitrate dehydrogenase kinase/phosphatase [Wenzhouxiangella marina]
MTPRPGQLNESVESAVSLIVTGFEDYNASFGDIARRGRRRFEAGDRQGMRRDVVERMALYDQGIDELIGRLDVLLASRLFSRSVWKHLRAAYERRIRDRLDQELYKTWFNTISRRLFKTRGVDPKIEFMAPDIDPTDRITHPVSRHVYAVSGRPAATFERILRDHPFSIDYGDVRGDARKLAEHMASELKARGEDGLSSIELLETVFYREGRAYLVGRAFARDAFLPCVIALKAEQGEVRVDALLCRRIQVSILFGFTFSYFLADLPTVGDAVVFLRTLLPDKPLDELYTVLGRAKQGKTERYRAFYRHIEQAPKEQMQAAEGTPGMVMMVFTLPSYPLVFKLLRDRFDPAKKVHRKDVFERYHLVYRHDRVGRLLDAQEFKDLRFDASRFPEPLRQELVEGCSKVVNEEEGSLVIRHCWVERRVRPLNLYLKEVDDAQAEAAVLDMGQALKDLARSNIFAGDLLPKNFGVTRSGRVVFYDYDELMLLTDCRFRRIPEARDFTDIYSSQPWYSIEDNDVFPEEFRRFMGLKRDHMALLERVHGELFDADWWAEVQSRIRSGQALDVPPYNEGALLSCSG